MKHPVQVTERLRTAEFKPGSFGVSQNAKFWAVFTGP